MKHLLSGNNVSNQMSAKHYISLCIFIQTFVSNISIMKLGRTDL